MLGFLIKILHLIGLAHIIFHLKKITYGHSSAKHDQLLQDLE